VVDLFKLSDPSTQQKNKDLTPRMARALLRWTLVVLAFGLTVIVTFLPVMFGLGEILPHKSSDLPDAMLFWSTVAVTFVLGAVAARFVHRRLQRRSSLPGSIAGA
jgi:hypothetical protein